MQLKKEMDKNNRIFSYIRQFHLNLNFERWDRMRMDIRGVRELIHSFEKTKQNKATD